MFTGRYEIKTEFPGRLTYREGNREYVFPVNEEDGQVIIVGCPSRRRIHFFFAWYPDFAELSNTGRAKILPRLVQHFEASGKEARILEPETEDENGFVFRSELFECRSTASEVL